MTKQLKAIEIPFGAKDSELCGWEYTIPEGMEATIVDNKIVVKKKESEDERIIERIKKAVESYWSDEPLDEILAYLEKQGDIEYTRTDAFIEKAVDYIANNMRCDGYTLQTKMKFIKGFQNYMKGE